MHPILSEPVSDITRLMPMYHLMHFHKMELIVHVQNTVLAVHLVIFLIPIYIQYPLRLKNLQNPSDDSDFPNSHKNLDSALIRLSNYVRRMMMITVGNGMQYRFGRMNQGFYESLENPDRLKDFEDFLNAMGIECKLVLKKLPDGQRDFLFPRAAV